MFRFRRGVVVIFALIGAVAGMPGTRAQAPQTPLSNSSVDHIGIVVADIDKTSQAFREIFGVAVPPATNVGPLVLRGNVPNAGASKIRFTTFTMGGMNFEMMQPVSGPGPHYDFFQKFGQGMQHVGFVVKDQQASIDFLVSRGGTWTNANHVNMKEILGLVAESKVLPGGAPAARPAPPVTAETPMTGAVITHIGIMVHDIDKTSREYSEVFGVPVPKVEEFGPLTFPVNEPPNAAQSRVRFDQFRIGNMPIELIQPIAGPGPHRDHLDKFGQGLQHLAFNVKDQKTAIDYLVSKGGKWTMAPYVDMKDILGFTLEVRTAPAK